MAKHRDDRPADRIRSRQSASTTRFSAERPLHCYEYPRPAVTVDSVLFSVGHRTLHVLLVRRAQEPFLGRWALPGGFVDPDEPLETAAARELFEETGVRSAKMWPIAGFGDPGRDPRGWTIAVAFYALVPPGRCILRPGDDAGAVAWHPANHPPPLAFDHRKIVRGALDRLRRDIYVLPVARPSLPTRFSLQQLCDVYTFLEGAIVPARVLKRRLMDAGLLLPVGSGRPALFRFGA